MASSMASSRTRCCGVSSRSGSLIWLAGSSGRMDASKGGDPQRPSPGDRHAVGRGDRALYLLHTRKEVELSQALKRIFSELPLRLSDDCPARRCTVVLAWSA